MEGLLRDLLCIVRVALRNVWQRMAAFLVFVRAIMALTSATSVDIMPPRKRKALSAARLAKARCMLLTAAPDGSVAAVRALTPLPGAAATDDDDDDDGERSQNGGNTSASLPCSGSIAHQVRDTGTHAVHAASQHMSTHATPDTANDSK